MKYDVLIYDCQNVFDATDPAYNMIRIDGLSESDANTLATIFSGHGVNICLFPWQEE